MKEPEFKPTEDKKDTITEYFECVTVCDDEDKECVTECVTILKE